MKQDGSRYFNDYRLNMYLTLFTEILLFYFKLCYFFFLIVYVLFKTEILERIS